MKICNLDYLKSHASKNPTFVDEIVRMFLEQTPVYIAEVARCLAVADWNGLHGNIHKIRPSIDLIGMPKDIGMKAKQIEEYSIDRIHLDLIPGLFATVESAFTQAYAELKASQKNNSSISG